MSYKVQIFDDSGSEVLSEVCEAVLLSTVTAKPNVVARCYGNEAEKCYIAGAIVAAEGLVETMFDEMPDLRSLCDECQEFCCSELAAASTEPEVK